MNEERITEIVRSMIAERKEGPKGMTLRLAQLLAERIEERAAGDGHRR
jgi:hypothetical protein